MEGLAEPVKRKMKKKKVDDSESESENPNYFGRVFSVGGANEEVHNRMKHLKLPVWKPESIKKIDFPAILLCGKRRTGKSFFTRWLLEYMKDDYPFGIIFSETRFNGFWNKHFPEAFLHEKYQDSIIKELLLRQTKLKELELKGELKIDHRCFVLFDDVLGDSSHDMRFSNSLITLLTAGRHFGITVLFAVQDAYALSPVIRNQIDLMVLFRQQQKRNIIALYENFLSTIFTSKEASALIEERTKDKHVLIVDSSGSVSEDNTIFICKASEPKDPSYKLCSPEMWALAREINREEHGELDSDEEDFKKYAAVGKDTLLLRSDEETSSCSIASSS